MTRFSIAAAKSGHRLITRDGRHAEFACVLDGGQPAPVLVNVFRVTQSRIEDIRDKIRDGHEIGEPTSVMENYYDNGGVGTHDHPKDIFIAEIGD